MEDDGLMVVNKAGMEWEMTRTANDDGVARGEDADGLRGEVEPV